VAPQLEFFLAPFSFGLRLCVKYYLRQMDLTQRREDAKPKITHDRLVRSLCEGKLAVLPSQSLKSIQFLACIGSHSIEEKLTEHGYA
jgi:hypothetical protein